MTAEEIRTQAAGWQDANRIIFDVYSYLTPERAAQLDGTRRSRDLLCPDRGGRCRDPPPAGDRRVGPGLARQDQRRLVGEATAPIIPIVPNLRDLFCRDFKIFETPPQLPQGLAAQPSGLRRLVHDLRGVRVGVALGGGAARGMSHLGVLKALERNGIVVDTMVAGTSDAHDRNHVLQPAWIPTINANQFATDLCPSWIFRCLPRGNHWYLLYKYRHGQFDPMLRKYLHDMKPNNSPSTSRSPSTS